MSASAAVPMLASEPLSIPRELDPCAVHQQVEEACRSAARDLGGDGLLSATQGGKIWNGPIQPCHPQNAGRHSCCLPERQAKEHFHHLTELDRRIGERRRSALVTSLRRESYHVLIEPDQQRPAQLQRFVIGFPVRRAVAARAGLLMPSDLTRRIHDLTHRIHTVNPLKKTSATMPILCWISSYEGGWSACPTIECRKALTPNRPSICLHRHVQRAAIDQQVLADDEFGLLAAKECASGAEICRAAVGAGRDGRLAAGAGLLD